ncbi:tRNA pseudouridine(55) synthase TruB [Phascolarctobacterium sp.]|uniref:tRNA pseudouridine(55) synthase TruB n=1 Tax=Phascolarctobacterium sp. TaxID=2049039 RepID=UPI002A7F85AC|nr:tRNA pseudouridine(55) synthase TruB [Phascolarctobacterium sp.]MDY5045746.1 tRNA pseudouridine(55) synthase TruB [Phascolarctobacterium sp.]
MDGIFNVLKPPGMTSHDVIGFLRRALNTKKIGHGGTLDPDAAGVLPVFAGTATRLLSYAMEGRKQYIAEFTLGEQRDTGDDSGTLVKTMPVPELSEAKLKEVLQSFLGKQIQLPPMYSAVKINGQKLYQLARKGVEVERKARPIEIYKLELLDAKLPTESISAKYSFTVAVECSKGTYIRVLGEDIATALGTCGTMSFLLRTQVGSYLLNEAHTLQEIAENPAGCCAEPITAVSHLPKLELTANQAARITNGVRTTVNGTVDGQYALLGPNSEFLGIGKCVDSKVQAEKIFEKYIVQL